MLGDGSSYVLQNRFRWIFCQLEVLQHCLPASIRQTLDQLPESLDETYLRMLSQIPQTNQAHAHRMLQCLVVAVRPLYVKELAELLAFEFNAAQGGIPKYRPSWRLDDQTQAVLSTCSSLVTIVDDQYGRQVVQFSHFSVKEFLMSSRLTSPLGDFSGYQIRPGPAHIILTQACLGFLLHLNDQIDKKSIGEFPLAKYAAEHWVDHAQFEDVASHVKDGMETLFDCNKPHFEAWIGIHDMDPYPWYEKDLERYPLYYAACCGFYDLVKHLAVKHPQHVNAIYGRYHFPLLALLSEGHFEVAELLLKHGANVNVRESTGRTILLEAFSEVSPRRLVGVVRFLLEHGADVNARDDALRSSLYLTYIYGDGLEAVQVLLEHNADVNSQDIDGKTPLHFFLSTLDCDDEETVLNFMLLLLKHGVEINKRDKYNHTPLHLAILWDWFKVAGSLLAHGADVNMENNDGNTPLHILSQSEIVDELEGNLLNFTLLLLKHGADVNRRDKDNQTPLHLAIGRGWIKVAGSLLAHGADFNSENNDGKTPLCLLSESRSNNEGDILRLALLLLKHGAEPNMDNQASFQVAIRQDYFKIAAILFGDGKEKGKNRVEVCCVHAYGSGSGVPIQYIVIGHLTHRSLAVIANLL